MAVFLSPIFNDAPYTVGGVPAASYKLFTYTAGTTAKQTTYTTSAGSVANPNPIILNAAGYSPNEIWMTSGVSYKLVLAPANDSDPPASPIWTRDNISAINDISTTVTEWSAGPVPTFISTTSFSLVGDQTSTFTKGLRLKFTVTAGTVYGTILTSVFTTLTTITLEMDTGQVLDSGLSAVSYAILNAAHPSMPAYLETMPIAVDHTDPTKRIKLSATAIPTGTTETLAVSAAGVIEGVAGTAIASAATVNLDTATGDYVHVTGTTPVTAITLSPGRERTVVFDSTPVLTNGAALILRNGISRTAAANEMTVFRGEAAQVVREISSSPVKQKTNQLFTSGSGTYTTPSGAVRLSIRMAAGGAGGQGGGPSPGAGTAGGNTTFGPLTCTGGSGQIGGGVTGGDLSISGSNGGVGDPGINGHGADGGASLLGMGGNGGSGNAAGFGGGGSGGNAGSGNSVGGNGGGGGGYIEKTITSPSATYSYAVGAAGSGGAAGTGSSAGGNGTGGVIIVDEFYI